MRQRLAARARVPLTCSLPSFEVSRSRFPRSIPRRLPPGILGVSSGIGTESSSRRQPAPLSSAEGGAEETSPCRDGLGIARDGG